MLNYFFNYGTRVPFDKNLNMADPAFRYEHKTLLNTQVANPFRNYLTPDKFPGQLRNTATVSLGSLLVPYPAVRRHHTDQHGRQEDADADLRDPRAAAVREGHQLPRRLRVQQREASGVVRRHRAVQDLHDR